MTTETTTPAARPLLALTAWALAVAGIHARFRNGTVLLPPGVLLARPELIALDAAVTEVITLGGTRDQAVDAVGRILVAGYDDSPYRESCYAREAAALLEFIESQV